VELGWRNECVLRTLVLGFFVLIAETAAACQCGGERTLAEARKYSAYIVTGIVTAVHPSVISSRRLTFRMDDLAFLLPVTNVEIDVTQSIGSLAPAKIELTHIECCACHANLELGREYLLFVLHSHIFRDAYEVSYCFPNRPIASAGSLLRQLPPPVRYRSHGRESRLAWMRWRLLAAANVIASYWLRESQGERYQPLRRLLESPWLPFSYRVFAGLAGGIAVVAILRRARRSAAKSAAIPADETRKE